MKARWLPCVIAFLLLAASTAALAQTTPQSPGQRLAQAMRGEEAATQCSACLSDCGRRYRDICHSFCHSYACWVLCGRKRAECDDGCQETLACRSRRRGSCQAPSLAQPSQNRG